MAGPRARTDKPGESRKFTPEEADECSTRLRKRIAEIENPELKGAGYNDPRVETLEKAISATVTDTFGNRSVEAMQYGGFRFARQRMARTSNFLRGGGDNRDDIAADMQRQYVESLPRTVMRLQGLIDLIAERTVVAPRATGPSSERSASHATGHVFVVHGHNEAIKQELARTVERLGLTPVILHEQPDGGRTIIEKLEDHADEVDFAVVLMTADDVGGSDAEHLRPHARQNVVLELGMFVGKLGRKRVRVLYETGVEMPSDYLGVLYIPLDPGGAWRLRLVSEMKSAGLKFDANRLFGD